MRTRWEYLSKGLKRPPQVVSADLKAVAGDFGTAVAGFRGKAIAGRYGKAIAGNYGTAIAGFRGTAIAGKGGTAKAGVYGTAMASNWGKAQAGEGGRIEIEWIDTRTSAIHKAVGYVGENGLKPDTWYRVDDQGNFVEVDLKPLNGQGNFAEYPKSLVLRGFFVGCA